ncbi:MAG: family 43 glycosylhydrolase, partial [bacterium]|nr:family 43 glycosylhydrolase [bacterium]
CEKIGPAETAKLNPPKPDGTPDTTHLDYSGSPVFARLVVEELRKVAPALAPVLRAEPRPREYTNPIISGDWSDPGVIRVGDDYYSCRSSFGWQPGIPIAHSRDLVHWEYIGYAFAAHPKLRPGDTRLGIWGVDLGYNPNTGQFLIYAPTRDGEVFVYYSAQPGGPYAGKSLGANLGIDPGFFADEDGKLYLLTNKAVIHELTPDGLAIVRDVATVDRSRYKFFEGPDIFRHDGWYYLLFSDGGTLPHEPSTISTLRARTLTGPWESDPANPVMFSTDQGARFEAPAHGTLVETQQGEWFLTYHAHETAYYSLGRQLLMQPVEWTADGWWRPTTGKVPTASAPAPALPETTLALAQSDEFNGATLGLQWFFTCAPDFSGAAWSLTEKPGSLRIHAQPGDLGSISALPGILQQRVTGKVFSVETKLIFSAAGNAAAGLHLYHDPLMNLWLAATRRDGKAVITVGKYNLGTRTDLWTEPNPHGDTVHLKIAVDGNEQATFFFGPDGKKWQQVGGKVYFGASGHHLRDGRRGDPDLGWVGRYKDPTATPEEIRGTPNPALPERRGNVWTAATFGVFAVRDGAASAPAADFDYLHVTLP